MPASGEHHPAFEEYCECIFELHEDDVEVIQARIAERLQVSRPAVSEMMKRLEAEGLITSDDGIHWRGRPQPQIEWDTASPPPTPPDEGGFEVGGCQDMNGRYYLVGGWFNYMGSTGYGVYSLRADAPEGPFRADVAAYRLCGNSSRWVALWARFCPTPNDVLINGYMYSGFTYETGETGVTERRLTVKAVGA